MDNKKQLLIIIFAVACGIVATVTMGSYVKNKIQEETTKLDKDYKRQLSDVVQQQNQKSEQQMMALAEEINRLKVETAELKSQPKVSLAVAQQEIKPKKPSLALRTPPGKRAVTAQINSLSAVGGLINPGDFVDVIAQLNVPQEKAKKEDAAKATKDMVTVMVFQNLQVLAIDTNLEETGAYDKQQGENSLKLTFAMDPREAGLMKFIEKNGTLELALRSPTERGSVLLPAATWETLAEYVLKNHGASIKIPKEEEEDKKSDKKDETPDKEEKPDIQIFRGGKEL